MFRRLLVGALLSGVAIGVFAGTSGALQSSDPPKIRDTLAIGDVPATALSDSDAVAINNLIGAGQLLDRVGITAESYAQARKVGVTPNGPVYFIPGSGGACLAIPSEAVSCGDPGTPGNPTIALVGRDRKTGLYSGVGVASRNVGQISLRTINGQLRLPLQQGIFKVHGAVPFESIKGFDTR